MRFEHGRPTLNSILRLRRCILKIDAEGSEIDILAGLPSIDFGAVMLEYHSEQNRRRTDVFLPNHVLIGGEVRRLNRGVLKYVHQRLLA